MQMHQKVFFLKSSQKHSKFKDQQTGVFKFSEMQHWIVKVLAREQILKHAFKWFWKIQTYICFSECPQINMTLV